MLSPLTTEIYEVLLDALIAGVWVWDIETGEEWWSDRYYNLLGYEPGEIKASYHAFLYELVHDEDRHLFIDDEGKPIFIGTSIPTETRLKMKDGTYRWFEATGKLIYNNEGKPVKMTGSIIDRHKPKVLQTELQQSLNVITEQNKKLNNFANIVTHNLRSHAGNMKGILQLISFEDVNAELKENLDYLSKISSSLNQTINHLDELVKIHSDVKLSKVSVQLWDVFNSVIAVLAPDIKKYNAIVNVDFNECSEVNYIHAYMESILLNLLSNSMKYRHNNREPVIDVKTFKKAGRCYLKVSDNGIGIDLEKNGNKIFGLHNIFHKQPDSRGVGLYITKNQVESFGGNITVKSELGKGSVFLVQF